MENQKLSFTDLRVRPVNFAELAIRYCPPTRDSVEWIRMVRDYDPDLTDDEIRAAKEKDTSPKNTKLFLIEYGDIIVGFVQYLEHDFFFRKRGPVIYLSDVYVKPEYRCRGILGHVLDWLMIVGQNERWSRLYWVTDKDHPIRPLYDKYAKFEFVRYHHDF